MNKLLTTKELVSMLGITSETIYQWRKKGMPFIKVQRAVRFDWEDVKAWMKENSK